MAAKKVSFVYRNHRGAQSWRTIEFDSLEFHFNPGFEYQPGWFISGFDLERNARRSFALSHIVLSEHERDNKPNYVAKLFNMKEYDSDDEAK